MRLPSLTAFALSLAALSTAAPSITGVYNAGSWQPTALPNSGIAQGAIFTVTGSGLGPSTLVQAQSYPLPTTQGLSGTTCSVKVGSVTETCIMAYTFATQVAALLPSATPVGAGTITIVYQGASVSSAIQVVAGVFGMFTLNEGGTGPAVVTDVNYNPITMVNAAHSGDELILWGTGLGAVSGDETEPPPNINIPGVQVLIENVPATVLYAGRSSSPGLDQINVIVPAGISGGCKTSVAVIVNGVAGNVVSTSITAAGQITCGDTIGALTAANLSKAQTSGSLNIGDVDLVRVGSLGDDELSASFFNYPLNNLIRSTAGAPGPSIGSCISYEQVDGDLLVLSDPEVPYLTPLNAGSSVTVTPAGGSAASAGSSSTGQYSATVGTPSSVFIVPGSYTASNGKGGSQVPAFSWPTTLPAPIAFVGFPSTVTRSQPLTVNWTNSSAFSVVTIFAISAVPIGSSQNSYAEILCTASASATSFTIPAALLGLLPTNGLGLPDDPGVLFEIAGIISDRTTVASSPGLDAGIFSLYTSNGTVSKAQ